MKKALNWIAGLFRDEKGNPSSKRFVGIIAGLTLCITMYVNSYTHGDIKPSDTLVNAVAMLAFGCLGLASVDKIWGKKEEKTEE
jgi:xanthine/uracil permease